MSCLRSATASSMSTSTLSTNSGAVALDSAIRRATVCCRRVSSWVSDSPRPVCASPLLAGVGDRRLRLRGRLLRGLGRGRGRRGGRLGSPGVPAAASTSALTIRPPGPVPSTSASSTPMLACHPAGDRRALMRPLSGLVADGSASAAGCSARAPAGCRRRRAPPPPRPAAPRVASSSAASSAGLLGVLRPRAPRPAASSGSASGSSAGCSASGSPASPEAALADASRSSRRPPACPPRRPTMLRTPSWSAS